MNGDGGKNQFEKYERREKLFFQFFFFPKLAKHTHTLTSPVYEKAVRMPMNGTDGEE